MCIGLFLEYIVICLGLVLAFIVFSSNIRNSLNRSFFIFVIGSSIWIFCANLVFVGNNLFFIKPMLLGAEIMILGLVLLSQFFPLKDKLRISGVKNLFIFLIPWFLIFLLTFSKFVIDLIDIDNDGYPNIVRGVLFWGRFVVMLFYVIWSIYILIKKHKKLKFENKTGFFRLITLTSLFAFSVLVCEFLLFMTLNSFMIALEVFILFLFIISMVYLIIKNKFIDINLIIKKSVLYGFSIISISIIYFIFSFLFEYFIDRNDILFHSLSGVSASVLCTIGFFYFKRDIENFTNKIFFRGEYDYFSAINNFGKISLSAKNLEELIFGMKKIIFESIKPDFFALFVIEKKHFFSWKFIENTNNLRIEKVLLNIIDNYADIFIDGVFINELKDKFKNVNDKNNKKCEELILICKKENISSIIPIFSREKMVSVMFIGNKLSGNKYFSQKDKELTSVISFEAGIAIENILFYENLKDYTEELRRKFEDKTEMIKNMYNDQSGFIADMSHEFQTPISILKGNLESLEQKKGSKNKSEFYTIQTTLDRLSRLVNNLLTVSRLNSPSGDIKKKKINIFRLLKRTYDDCFILTKDKGINFYFSSEKCFVFGYEDKLREVLLNLISNALKYTGSGGSINMSAKIDDEEVEIKISDTGIGIQKKDVEKIFERFYKINDSHHTGNGLGLYICRQIIEAHGGYIFVKSVLGKGSEFIIRMPRQKIK